MILRQPFISTITRNRFCKRVRDPVANGVLGREGAGVPTSARNRVLLLAFLVTGITYLDRVCVAAAAPAIMRDLRLSNMRMAYVFSVFALAYGLFEIPAGWLGDRIGQRKMLTRIVVCWSTFTAFTGMAWNYSVLVATRFVFGAAEAGAFPTLSRSLARWFPPLDRGRVNGVLWMGARLGGALAPPLANVLIGWWGWRLSFVAFGTVGFVWSSVFWFWYRDDPARHQRSTRLSSRTFNRVAWLVSMRIGVSHPHLGSESF